MTKFAYLKPSLTPPPTSDKGLRPRMPIFKIIETTRECIKIITEILLINEHLVIGILVIGHLVNDHKELRKIYA